MEAGARGREGSHAEHAAAPSPSFSPSIPPVTALEPPHRDAGPGEKGAEGQAGGAACGRGRSGLRPGAEAATVAALASFYAILGLVVLLPEAVYSGDIGVKYVQARALWANGLTSLDIPYPGAFLDPARQFFPLRPPFMMTASGATQAIFSPASAMLQALAVGAAGYPVQHWRR
jgi:hypothetical protein